MKSCRVCPSCGGKKSPYAKSCESCRVRGKHRLSYTPEYRAWQTMRLRCLEPSNSAYPAYGGRGITVCDRWKDSPQAFLDDMGPKPSPRHELDRIDNDHGYEPGNCRWATRSQNDRNRRNNRLIQFNGERRTLVEWAEELGMRADTIGARIDNGWTAERALTTPIRAKCEKGAVTRTEYARAWRKRRRAEHEWQMGG